MQIEQTILELSLAYASVAALEITLTYTLTGNRWRKFVLSLGKCFLFSPLTKILQTLQDHITLWKVIFQEPKLRIS